MNGLPNEAHEVLKASAKTPPNQNLYNTSVQLWAGAREHYKERGSYIHVCEGHVIAGSDGVVARFVDDDSAMKTLIEAGYVRETAIQSIVFKP